MNIDENVDKNGAKMNKFLRSNNNKDYNEEKIEETVSKKNLNKNFFNTNRYDFENKKTEEIQDSETEIAERWLENKKLKLQEINKKLKYERKDLKENMKKNNNNHLVKDEKIFQNEKKGEIRKKIVINIEEKSHLNVLKEFLDKQLIKIGKSNEKGPNNKKNSEKLNKDFSYQKQLFEIIDDMEKSENIESNNYRMQNSIETLEKSEKELIKKYDILSKNNLSNSFTETDNSIINIKKKIEECYLG